MLDFFSFIVYRLKKALWVSVKNILSKANFINTKYELVLTK